MKGITDADAAELDALARRWDGGDAAEADEVAEVLAAWRTRLGLPEGPDEERFDVVDPQGRPRGWVAPRWFCHLTGLRHRVIHILLLTPQRLLVLQMRAHDKAEWPSLFDTTVGGHLKAGQGWLEGAWGELEEELGLGPDDLEEGALMKASTPQPREDALAPPRFLRNRQVNQLFTGHLSAEGLARLSFADGEVDGVYLCRPVEAARMILADPDGARVAPGLRHAFWLVDWDALGYSLKSR